MAGSNPKKSDSFASCLIVLTAIGTVALCVLMFAVGGGFVDNPFNG